MHLKCVYLLSTYKTNLGGLQKNLKVTKLSNSEMTLLNNFRLVISVAPLSHAISQLQLYFVTFLQLKSGYILEAQY